MIATAVRPEQWFLTLRERGNTAARLYADCDGDRAWTAGNDVRPLVDGANYFTRLCQELRGARAGDRVYFVDWRGDPDERLDGPGTAVMVELARAVSAGAHVAGLVWRSHLDHLRFSQAENRNLSQALQAIGSPVMLDQRVRRGGSHHQKFVVIRHPDRPDRDVAFVGGTDLGHGRRDDHRHLGDPQAQRMPAWYGPTPPWHDAMVEIHGPAVADVECCFRERWEDPTALEHLRPWLRVLDRLRGLKTKETPLPDPLPPPPSQGGEIVQLLRTYPSQSPSYPFAPMGERTVALGYAKALARARRLVYVEDQFLWDTEVAAVFAAALRCNADLQLVAVVPRFPDSEGGLQQPAKDATHAEALRLLYAAGGDRVHVFNLENGAGTPVYVHAKICLIDDVWAAVGSANLNRRSWTHDSELTAAVLTASQTDEDNQDTFARRLRLQLWCEHLGRSPGDHEQLLDLGTAPGALGRSADRLQCWHQQGRVGQRPPGMLRPHLTPEVSSLQRRVLRPFIRAVVDPDGRPAGWRHAGRW